MKTIASSIDPSDIVENILFTEQNQSLYSNLKIAIGLHLINRKGSTYIFRKFGGILEDN